MRLILKGILLSTALLIFSSTRCTSRVWDISPLKVTDVKPAANSVAVPVNSKVTVTFSREIDFATLEMTVASGGVSIPGSLSFSGNTVVFTPSTEFRPNSSYTTLIQGHLADTNGNVIGSSYQSSFFTGPRNTWYTYLGEIVSGSPTIVQANDGGFFILGQAASATNNLNGITAKMAYQNTNDLILVKLDAAGTAVWYTYFEGTSATVGDIAPTQDGGCIVSGTASANISQLQGISPLRGHSGGTDIITIKLNRSGDISWYTFIGGPGDESGRSLVVTNDGGFVIGGRVSGATLPLSGTGAPINTSMGVDSLLVKLNADGTISWHTFLNGTFLLLSNWIAATNDGGCIVSAMSPGLAVTSALSPLNPHSVGGSMEYVVIKLDALGGITWYSFFGQAGYPTSAPYTIVQTAEGGYAISGLLFAANLMGQSPISTASGNMSVLRLDSAGSLLWYTLVGFAGYGTVQRPDGGFTTAGRPGHPGLYYGTHDAQLVSLDAAGNQLWSSTWGGGGNEIAYGIVQTADGGHVFVGTADAANDVLGMVPPVNPYGSGVNMVVVRLNADGSF